MDVQEKIELLADDARFEVCAPWGSKQSPHGDDAWRWITPRYWQAGA